MNANLKPEHEEVSQPNSKFPSSILITNLFTVNPQSILHDFQNFRQMHRPFGKSKRKIIFFLIFLINMIINFDHGMIPAATTTLKLNLNLNNFQLGIIGSLVYLGLVLGALSAGFLYQNYSPKWVVSIALIMSSFFLYFFTITENIIWMGMCRVGCGFFQVFCLIYFPVWVDEYGVKNLRTIWLSFLQLGVPLGTMLGYLVEAICINSNLDLSQGMENNEEANGDSRKEIMINTTWKNGFYIQIMVILILVVFLIFTPDKFFSKNYRRSNIDTEKFREEYEIQLKTDENTFSTKYYKHKAYKTIRRDKEVNKYGRLSEYSIYSIIDQNDEGDGLSYIELMKDLFDNKVYVFTLLSICCLMFIITGIQFWISDYMIIILKVKRETVFLSYIIVCISAPVLGVLFGGYIIQNAGGYTTPLAMEICLKYAIYAACFGVFTSFLNNYIVFISLIWLLLFFGASIVPGLTGIMLSSLGDYSKEVANSITHLCYNLFGYLPSPLLYGLICSFTGGEKSRWGLRFLMFVSILGVGMLYLARERKRREGSNGNIFHEREKDEKHEKMIFPKK